MASSKFTNQVGNQVNWIQDHCSTAESFIQVVYDLHVLAYVRGQVCLMGDASSIARPHTAGGAIKAQQQAMALNQALRAWNEARMVEWWDATTRGMHVYYARPR